MLNILPPASAVELSRLKGNKIQVTNLSRYAAKTYFLLVLSLFC